MDDIDLRKLLLRFSFSYIGGDGQRYDNAYNVAMNITLVLLGLRPAFLILENDYDEGTMRKVLRRVNRYLDLAEIENFTVCYNRDNRLTRAMIRNVTALRQEYNRTGDRDIEDLAELALGRLLGYPCAGQLGGNFLTSLRVLDQADIITNICNTADSQLESDLLLMNMEDALLATFREFLDEFGLEFGFVSRALNA